MITYEIIGRSNTGNKLIEYLKKDKNMTKSIIKPDVVFLVGSKESMDNFEREDYPNSRIIDISSKKRLHANSIFTETGKDILYAIPDITTKSDYRNYTYVSNPGCSAIGSIMGIYPLLGTIERNIILDVKFSKSSLTRNSSFNKEKNIMTTVYPFEHNHQKEVSHFFGFDYNIKMVPSVIDVESGISINIHAFRNNFDRNEEDLLYRLLKFHYKNNKDICISKEKPFDVRDFINTNKMGIYIKEGRDNILVNVVFDNLTIGGAYTAYQNSKLIMGE